MNMLNKMKKARATDGFDEKEDENEFHRVKGLIETKRQLAEKRETVAQDVKKYTELQMKVKLKSIDTEIRDSKKEVFMALKTKF